MTGDRVSLFPFHHSSTTTDATNDSTLLRVTRDERRGWIVVDDYSTVYGYGETLLEAVCDFCAALRSHLAVMDDDTITPRLQAQKRRILWLLERADKGGASQ